MTALRDPITQLRHESDAGCWEMADTLPSPTLRPWVVRYSGYRETGPGQRILRREVPSTVVALIINFASPFAILDPRPNAQWILRNTFIAGLHKRPALVESDGRSHCLQIDFTPLGACRFFGSSLADINHATTPLDDAMSPADSHLVEQLYHARNWRRRFELVDSMLLRRFATALQPRAAVDLAWRLMAQSRGAIRIAELAQRMNCSREHCSRLIRSELGMSPKNLARVIRFDYAVNQLKSANRNHAELAVACGYADQSHFISEIKAMSGCSPVQLMARYAEDTGLVEPPCESHLEHEPSAVIRPAAPQREDRGSVFADETVDSRARAFAS